MCFPLLLEKLITSASFRFIPKNGDRQHHPKVVEEGSTTERRRRKPSSATKEAEKEAPPERRLGKQRGVGFTTVCLK